MFDFEYKVMRRPNRKTAAVSVKDSSVRVHVPQRTSDKRVEEIVRRKARWIREKLRYNREVRQSYRPKEYVSGEAFQYLGKNYRLKVVDGNSKDVSLVNGRFYVQIPDTLTGKTRDHRIVSRLTVWYQQHALEHLQEKVRRFSAQLVVQPSHVGIKNYRSRWGSCTSRGEVYFNWRIIMAPQRIVDYVVAHEVCHLVHHNHSQEYWKLLESVIPGYRECKDWLKVNGQVLEL